MKKKKPKPEDVIPRLIIPKNATLRQIYKICKENFTAADLQKFTEDGPMVSADELLADLERIHQEETRLRKKRKP